MSALDSIPHKALLELPGYVQQEYQYYARYRYKMQYNDAPGHTWEWCFKDERSRREHMRAVEYFVDPDSIVYLTGTCPKNADFEPYPPMVAGMDGSRSDQ